MSTLCRPRGIPAVNLLMAFVWLASTAIAWFLAYNPYVAQIERFYYYLWTGVFFVPLIGRGIWRWHRWVWAIALPFVTLSLIMALLAARELHACYLALHTHGPDMTDDIVFLANFNVYAWIMVGLILFWLLLLIVLVRLALLHRSQRREAMVAP